MDNLRLLRRVRVPIAIFAMLTVPAGCVLAPREWDTEKQRAARAAEPYRRPFARRTLPELPAQPTWQEVLRRALLANGDLEAAYHEWSAAVWRVQQAGAYPNSSLSVGFQYAF